MEHIMMVVMLSLVVSDFFFWKKTAVITEEATFTHMVKRKLFRTPLIKLHGSVIKPWQSCLRTCFSCIHALWLLKYSMVRFMVMCVDFIPSHRLLLLNCYTGQLFKADVGGDTEKPLNQRL